MENKLTTLEQKFCDLEKKYEDVKVECNEVTELRTLNRQLQEKLLDLTRKQGKFHKGFLFF